MKASIERAFAALTDPQLFPTWGPERIEGKLAVGERPIFDFGPGGKCAVYIVAIEPPRYFAYRWKQGETDPAALLGDPLAGPNTLVEFKLETLEGGGTRIRVIESEIDKLPVPPGIDVEQGLEQMGKGWELMLGGLPRHFTLDTADRDKVENEIELRTTPERVHAALLKPADWWMGAPTLEVVGNEAPRYLSFRWPREGDASTLVEFHLEDIPGGTRVKQRETGLASLPGDTLLHLKRAHQAWGVVLGMLGHHFA